MSRATAKAWCHVDMDGLDIIYGWYARGRAVARAADEAFYTSAVENSLAFFSEHSIRATYFCVARDLDNPSKRRALESVVEAGHHVASHGVSHRHLTSLSTDEKRNEIYDSKRMIEDAFGMPCRGFRAPGYSIDYEALQLLAGAGYEYDSSVIPSYHFRRRLGLPSLRKEPFLMFPDRRLFEIPLPYVLSQGCAFHPCYSFHLSRMHFYRCFSAFRRNCSYFTLLFHLPDFSSRQAMRQSPAMHFFTNNLNSWRQKEAFSRALVSRVRRDMMFTTTEQFLDAWPSSAPDLNPRTVLGVGGTHETGACVVRDGSILSAVSEERLSRRKLDSRYPPKEAIKEAIRIAGVSPQEIDAVAIGGLHWKDLLPQLWESIRRDVRDFHSLRDYIPHFCRILYRFFYLCRTLGYERLRPFLRQEFGISPKVYYVEHHDAHAASAYFTGGVGTAAVFTADGVGDEVSITVSSAADGAIHRLHTCFYPNSFGVFYAACTQLLGFKAGRHEGKITGLSGFGKPNRALLEDLERTVLTDKTFKLNKGFYAEGFLRGLKIGDICRKHVDLETITYRLYKTPLAGLLRGYSREDVAYAFQFILEREMIRLLRRCWDCTGGPILLAGGVFANVRLNMIVSDEFKPDYIYIFPNMGDGGLSTGAALSVAACRPEQLQHVYLGTGYREGEMLEALEQQEDLESWRPEDLSAAVADMLVAGKIVARFDGRMEYGPRALGNRSILYHCGDPSVNTWLNQQLKRTEFMPFAPICRFEDADEYFVMRESDKHAAEFMTIVTRCTEKMKETCPAAVHVDGTARPQLLRREVNPGMYDILTAYKQRTGIACLINTSFNMHEEPIVRSPRDAVSAFVQSGMDYLVLGPLLVKVIDRDVECASAVHGGGSFLKGPPS